MYMKKLRHCHPMYTYCREDVLGLMKSADLFPVEGVQQIELGRIE